MQNLQEALIAGGFISQGPSLQQLKADQNFAQQKAEAILAKCEEAGRAPTEAENKEIDMALEAVKSLTSKIQTKQHRLAQRATNQGGVLLIEGGRQFTMPAKRRLSIQYASDFHEYLASRGSKMGDALQEGADGQGGFVIPGLSAASYEGGSTTGQPITPSIVDQQIIELAPAETGVRLAASVIPTVMDIKLPRKTGFGSVAIKAESGGGTNLFADSDATLEQFTLSAFMIGGSHTVSWELMQDVPAFQRFVVTDLLLDHSVYEDNLFVNGNGTGQPEGLIGNTGTGVTGVAAGSDSYASELLKATFSVQGQLNAMYFSGASWLLNRATGVVLRQAQDASEPVCPCVDPRERDRLSAWLPGEL